LCELIFEVYAYRIKFTGDGVFMLKKKDGGIDPGSVWPDHPVADRASPAEPPNCYTEAIFGSSTNSPGAAGLTAGASGLEAGATGLIAEPASRTASNGQISTHL
jgi:hypothetical protein